MFLLLLFTLISISYNCKLDPLNNNKCELNIDNTKIGCSDSTCTLLCNMGQFDCKDLTQIICSYGYFNYLNTCIRCPKQTYTDYYTIYCGDCIDNSQTWQNTRLCTYDFIIDDIDYNIGTYIKKINSYNEFYYIISISTTDYETLLCSGCSNLCNEEDDDCHKLSTKLDKDIQIIQCLIGYYFFNDACIACIQNCIKCNNKGKCQECLQGYYLDDDECKLCQTNCLNCQNSLCYQCQNPTILSLDRKTCLECGDSCLRCEYVSYDDTTKYQYITRSNMDPDPSDITKYFKRCRQCENDYTLYYNGEKCVQCYIPNCQQCYYKIGIRTTMDLDFIPLLPGETASTMLCYLCNNNYYLKDDLSTCIPLPPAQTITDCQLYGQKLIAPLTYQGQCLRCIKVLDFTNNICDIDSCNKYIKNCLYCFKYNDILLKKIMKLNTITNIMEEVTSNAELLYQCTKCNDGYYADFFTGLCNECPNHCTECWQYSQSYNFTLYNQIPQILDDRYIFYNETIQIFCSKCETNYQLYNNQCLGCTNNCVSYNSLLNKQQQSCLYKSSYAVCSKCFEPYIQRSLKPDLSECWECPYYCQACQYRDIETSFNKYFNNIILEKYSRSCYKIQQYPLSSKFVFFNSYLNLPIICDTNYPCRHSKEIDVVLFCQINDFVSVYSINNKKYYYDIQSFYKEVSDDIATIKFENLETLEFYDELNKLPLEILKLNIYFKGDNQNKCNLVKSTQIITEFHKNIFALTDFTVNIATYNSQQLELNVDGNFTLTYYPKLIIKDITFITNSDSFIFNISNSKNIQLYNIKFMKSKQEIYSIYLQYIETLLLSNILFQGISSNISLSPILNIEFKTVIFDSLNLYQQQFIQIFPISNIEIDDFQIKNCNFSEITIIGDSLLGQTSGNIILNNINLKQCFFVQSYLFFSSNSDSLKATDIQILDNIFFQTELFVSNIFIMYQIIAHNNFFNSDSSIIQSSNEIDETKLYTLSLSNFTYINISNNTCYNSLIYLQTPYNQKGVLMNIEIKSLYIDFLTTFENNKAILNIYQVGSVEIQNFISHNLQKVTALQVIESQYVQLKSFECVSANLNTQLPIQDTCISDFNWYCIHIEDFDRGVNIENGIIKKQLGIDCSMIYIKSYDFLTKNTQVDIPGYQGLFYAGYKNEYIKIDNIKFYNVTLAIQDPQISIALIFIESSQKQIISISNIEFIGNHMHQWPPSINVDVATCILIESPLSNVTIFNLLANDNRATKTKTGLFSFIVYKLIINKTDISNTNVIQQNYADILDKHTLYSNDFNIEKSNIQNYFEISSIGTNFFIYSDDITIINVNITNSNGLDGTGFYIIGSQYVNITIINLIMKNFYCLLEYDTQGCGIFINTEMSSLNFIAYQLEMNKIIGYQGSGIYILSQSKKVVVIISNALFSDCEGIESQAFYFKQQTPTTIVPAMIFQNCTFQNVYFDNYLINLAEERPQLNLENRIDKCSIIYINFAQVTLNECKFKNMQLVSLLYIEDIILLNILDTIVENIQIGIVNLFDISLYSLKGSIFISGLIFQNITPYPEYTKEQYEILSQQMSITDDQLISNQFIIDPCITTEQQQNIQLNYQQTYFVGMIDNSKMNRNPPQQSIHNKQYTYYKIYSDKSEIQYSYTKLVLTTQDKISPSFFVLPELGLQSITINKLKVQNSECLNCNDGLIQMSNIYGNVTLQEINCINNIMGNYGCINIKGQVSEQNNFIVNITDSVFINNKANYGAGLSVINISLNLNNCQFYDNNASMIGGGLYYKYNYKNQINISNIIIDGNSADIAAALYLSGKSLPSSSITNNGNKGRSINEEIPQHLSIYMIDDIILPTNYTENIDTISMMLELPSGQSIKSYKFYYKETQEQIPYDWKFRIVNLDNNYNRILSGQSSDYCTISGRMLDQNIQNKSFTTNFTQPQQITFNNESYNLDNLIITFDPYLPSQYYLQLKFECSSIKIPIDPYPYQQYNNNYSLLLNLRTKQCQLGEAYQFDKCIVCNENQYSLNNNAKICTNMNVQSMEEVTPVMIKLYPGYWRYDNDVVDQCYNLQENCNGGWIPGDPSCFTGHLGALCESCDIYGKRGDQYSISTKYKCGQCSQTQTTNSITIIAICIFTLLQMILSVRGNYQMIENFIREQVLQSMGVRINNTQANLSILIKILINYIQIISALGTFRISIPTDLISSIDVVANPTQSMAYSLDCFLIEFAITEIIYFRMIWALVMPIFYLLIFFIGYLFGALLTILPTRIEIVYTTFIYMFIYLQPTFIGGFVALLSSRNLGGEDFVQSDVQYLYSTDNHYFWMLVFAGPNLIGWGMIFPYLFMHFIRKNYNTLTTIQTRRKYGYFYNEYTQHAYLWEFVKIFEKQFVLMALTYYEDTIIVKGLFVFLIVLIYGLLSFEFNPYQSKRLNFIDQISSAVCVVSLCLGVLIKASQNEDMEYLQIIMFFIIGFLNILFIFILIYELLRGYIDKFEEHIDKLRDKLSEKFPNLNKNKYCRKFLINRGQLKLKVKLLWSQLRYQTHLGIKRRRSDKTQPLFEQKSIIQDLERNDSHSRIESKANSRLSVMDVNQEDIQLNNNSSVHIKTPDIKKIYPSDSLQILKKKRI